MPRLSPVQWPELVRRLRRFGFDGPFQEGKHPYMLKEGLALTIPNPHQHEVGVDLLIRILGQAGIHRKEWLNAQ
ncbi:MAG: type II toxin-antitoxin system HicA family toxin [Candidatus Coatesbacteria bacterium]